MQKNAENPLFCLAWLFEVFDPVNGKALVEFGHFLFHAFAGGFGVNPYCFWGPVQKNLSTYKRHLLQPRGDAQSGTPSWQLFF